MSEKRLDISENFTWEEGLPRPQWELIENWVETQVEPENLRSAWCDIANQWLEKVRTELGREYQVVESDHVLLLAPIEQFTSGPYLQFAECCREHILGTLAGVARFQVPGKLVVVVLADSKTYYKYIYAYFPEGHHGTSAGAHIRNGYHHVAVAGNITWARESTLAHELTHAALSHLTLPQWVEEGLAQMYEHNLSGRSQLIVDQEMAQRHKRYWGRHGLDAFWRGEGFSQPGQVQELSYQLAEIRILLMVEDYRPRLFGLVKKQQRRLFSFLRFAELSDCGAEAAREYLACSLSDLTARFLGPGDWNPTL